MDTALKTRTNRPASFDEVRERFIDLMGEYMASEGLPRIAGRLMGLIIFETEPISFGDLARRLGVSRGSISTNARLLESQGLIERFSMEGERQDFFRLTKSPYTNLVRGITERMEATRGEVEKAIGALPPHAEAHRERLAGACAFFDDAVVSLGELAARLASCKGSER